MTFIPVLRESLKGRLAVAEHGTFEGDGIGGETASRVSREGQTGGHDREEASRVRANRFRPRVGLTLCA